MCAKPPSPILDLLFYALFVWGPFVNDGFQSHELKVNFKNLLQTDYIHSAASGDAALSVTQQKLSWTCWTVYHRTPCQNPASIRCALSHLCPQLSDHLPDKDLTSLAI